MCVLVVADLRDTAGLLQVLLDEEHSAMIFRGTTKALRSARMLLGAHVSARQHSCCCLIRFIL